ncbi:Ribosome biogenesis protein [Asimina triloba]
MEKDGFTRKPPKYERFIRPTGLRFTKAHVTHPELKCTFNLEIIGVKKNPNGPMYTSLGVMTKGSIIEVNVSELGLVTPAGKVVWGKIHGLLLDLDGSRSITIFKLA